MSNAQKKGYGIRGSLKFIKEGDPVNFLIEPYARYWHIKDSKGTRAENDFFIVTGLEPENTSIEIGTRLGVQF